MKTALFINGLWVAPVAGGTLPVIDPATEAVVHHIPAATAPDTDLAVKAARAAFDHGPWPRMSGAERAKALRAIAQGIRDRLPDLAGLEVIDNGKTLPEADRDLGDPSGCFDFCAGLAEELDGEVELVALPDARFTSKVVREPVGVAVAIIPWNYPLLMAAWKVAPALAACCTMVLKPSEHTSLTALELGRIVQDAGLPPGVLNNVTGLGAEVGQALVDHLGVDKIAFTGSVPTGARLMAAAARGLKTISLELEGKSLFVIFADSDIEKVVEWFVFGIFWNQEQVCSATSCVLVERSLHAPLLERLVAEAQYHKVMSFIDRAVAAGATLATGGKADRPKGYFVAPSILTDLALGAEACVEEIIGPVVCIRSFDTEDEAIAVANDTRFGRVAAVKSADDARAERVAAACRAGIVRINCSQPTYTEAPWGSMKQSGIGRELGRWGFDNYLETKQITRLVSDQPWGLVPERLSPCAGTGPCKPSMCIARVKSAA